RSKCASGRSKKLQAQSAAWTSSNLGYHEPGKCVDHYGHQEREEVPDKTVRVTQGSHQTGLSQIVGKDTNRRARRPEQRRLSLPRNAPAETQDQAAQEQRGESVSEAQFRVGVDMSRG